MNVELIAYSQFRSLRSYRNPLSIVEQAASVCYQSNPTPTYKIAKGCKSSGHLSVFEHISFTFHITGVTRALLAQLSRHRHISMSVQSQRYCDMTNFQYVNPFTDEETHELFDRMMESTANDYRILKDLYKEEKEDARAVLPNACCTELYLTANARTLIEISHLRLCTRSQKEIRELFVQIKKSMNEYAPEVASWMVPSCEKNPEYPFCTEGSKCCGRHPTLDKVYNKEDDND